MRTLLGSVSALCLSLSLGACTAKSLKTFEGKEQTLSEDYAEGASVTVEGVYGDIFVTRGEAGVVAATFKPFDYRGHDEEEQARQEMAENLDLDVSADGDGNIMVVADRHDSTNGLGSHITLELPPEFNGVLIVKNAGDGPINQGNIDVSFVGEATTLNVVNHGLENCNILRGEDDEPADVSGLYDTDVRCEGDITVRGVNDDVVVKSVNPAFHSHVRVEIASVSELARGGEITGDDSTIELIMPSSGDFNVVASAAGEGAHIGDVDPGDCEQTEDESDAAELVCGSGGPIYTVAAEDSDPDDDEASFVNLIVQ